MIDKLDDDEFDPNVIDNFINDTQRDIFNNYELSFQEKIFDGKILAGTYMFKMPKDVAMVQAHVMSAPDGKQRDMANSYLKFRDFNTRWPTPLNNEPATPRFWTSYAGNMIFTQPTDQDYQMNIFYIKKPAKLTQDTDVPEIPEEFEEVLVLGAFKRVLDRNEDYDQSAVIEREYNNKLNLLVARYGKRMSDGPIKMGNKQIVTRKR